MGGRKGLKQHWSQRIGWIAAGFAVLAAALLAIKPLLLDEVLTLIAARAATASEVLIKTREHTGNVPFGFLIEHWFLQLTGYSVWQARIPSALFGVASVFLTGVLARKLRTPSPMLAAALFAAFPLTLRYALEIRPYMPALFFSLALTLLFLELAERPTTLVTIAYAGLVVLTLYTQPFAALVCGAHFLWSVLYKRWRAATCIAVACIVGLASFVPWYLWARSVWTQEIVVRYIRFTFSAKTPLMLFRELTGAGYWGGGVVVLLCILSALRSRMDRRTQVLLLLLIAVPLAGGLLADAAFGYFLAARQFFWVLPALAILAVSAWDTRPREIAALLALAILLCGYKSVRYFTQPEPDWDSASAAIAAEVDRGACLRIAPTNAHEIYAYFVPRLDENRVNCSTVVAAVIPDAGDHDRDAIFEDLTRQGYAKLQTRDLGGTTMTIFQRASDH